MNKSTRFTTEASVSRKKTVVKKRNPIAGTMPGWPAPKKSTRPNFGHWPAKTQGSGRKT